MVANTRISSHHKKHYGHHQKRSKPFIKVYAPYIPLLLLVVANILIGFGWKSHSKKDVLGYATSMSPQVILDSTNVQRTANSVSPLALNSKLNTAAQAKANDMASRDYWSHDTPDGKTPWSFITNAGYSYTKAGENLAYGFTEVDGNQGLIQGWMNSPEHKANLINSSYTEVGFGIANAANYQGQSQETIVVAMYAKPYSTITVTKPSTSASKPTISTATPKLSPVASTEQTHEVIITILNKAGKPEPNVKVTLHSDPMVAYTDDNGVVSFKNVASGEHTAIAESAEGTAETKLQVTAAQEKVSLTVYKATPANQTSLGSASKTTPVSSKKSTPLSVLTRGNAPWLALLLTILAIMGAGFVVIKHSVKVHKLVVKGEKYVLRHALLDVTIVSFVVFCYLISRSVGTIL